MEVRGSTSSVSPEKVRGVSPPSPPPATNKNEGKFADSGDKTVLTRESVEPEEVDSARASTLTEALAESFGNFDKDGDGFLVESEISESLGHELGPDERAALASLRGRQTQIQSAHDDEWGTENDGLTVSDIESFEDNGTQDARILAEQFALEQELARETPLTEAELRHASPADLSELVGTRDYYLERYADFRRRNPELAAPEYYTDYGLKYFDRFHEQKPDLQPETRAWVDATGHNLQIAMEEARSNDPTGFARLERGQEAFRSFAYDTHPDAYVNSGLHNVPWPDRVSVGLTPDTRDLANWSGVRQVVETGSRVAVQDVTAGTRAGHEALERGSMFAISGVEQGILEMSGAWRLGF